MKVKAECLCTSPFKFKTKMNKFINRFYKEKLGIQSDEVLATMSWPEIVDKVIQEQQRNPFVIKKQHLTALEITNIIMREENFMIGIL